MTKKVWHDAKKELPEKSGVYVIFCDEINHIAAIEYSNFHKKFNCDDFGTTENAFDVDFWACLDDLNLPRHKPV